MRVQPRTALAYKRRPEARTAGEKKALDIHLNGRALSGGGGRLVEHVNEHLPVVLACGVHQKHRVLEVIAQFGQSLLRVKNW